MVGQSGSTGSDKEAVMSCPLCKSENQAEFTAETNIHFRGLKNVDNPGVLFLPNLLVCLDCGFSRFSIPKTELAQLVKGTSEASTDGPDIDSQNCA